MSTVIASIGPIVIAVFANQGLQQKVTDLEQAHKALQEQVIAQRDAAKLFRAEYAQFYRNMRDWRTFADASLCGLEVRVPHGCPDVSYLPAPMKASKAPKVQPAIVTKPLPSHSSDLLQGLSSE